MTRFDLSELQAQAILDMRLARLAALERQKIEDEYLAIIQLIAELEDILANPARVSQIIKDELAELKKKYAGERRTRVADDSSREMTDEDLIADEDVVVTISGRGYIKRQPVATYRRQHRGGKGIIGHVTREEDAVEHLLVANTHHWALFFTNRGRVFSAKVHAIPDASRQAKGIPIINLPGVQVESGEVPMATITLPDFKAGSYLVLATRKRRSSRRPRSSSSRRSARRGSGRSPCATTTSWPGSTSRPATTTSSSPPPRASSPASPRTRSGRWAATPPGVIGIRLARKGDSVVGMSVVQPDSDLLVLSETGYGKRVPLTEFRREASRRPGRPAHQPRGPQDRRRRRRPAGHRRGRGAAPHHAPAARSSGPRPTRSTATRRSARGVIVMRLAEGDRVVAIAAFRAGLAEQDGMGDDGAPGTDGASPTGPGRRRMRSA